MLDKIRYGNCDGVVSVYPICRYKGGSCQEFLVYWQEKKTFDGNKRIRWKLLTHSP